MSTDRTLQLKDLAPYLPYGLKGLVSYQDESDTEIVTLGIKSGKGNLCSIDEFLNNAVYQTKPLLRSLSDLTKEITHNGETFVPIERLRAERDCDAEWDFLDALEDDWASADGKIMFAPYSIINRMLEWHFDCFNLLPAGLAIAIQ